MKFLVRPLLPSLLAITTSGLLAHYSAPLGNLLFAQEGGGVLARSLLLVIVILPFIVAGFVTYRMSAPDIRMIADIEARLQRRQ